MTLFDAWWSHLGTVRWFGGKGAEGAITDLTDLPAYTAPQAVPEVRSSIATIDYTDGRREFYHLLVAAYPAGQAPVAPVATVDGVDIVDATTDPAAIRAFAQATQQRPGDAMTWTQALPDADAVEIKVWAGEQSNTTIVWGDTALFKLFRKVEPGPNLDAEVLAALADSDAATPALFGRLVGAWPAGSASDLGMVIERVAGAHDGWELACERCAAGHDFSDEAFALGEALAVVHRELAARFDTADADGAAIASVMKQRLATAVSDAPALAPYADALAAQIDALAGRRLAVQRVHGDFHLGQTLRSPAGWTIIDFEGEPAKSAAERRALDSTWRDVAGMLRSFDYARSAHAVPESAEARSWANAAQTAFCRGYGAHAADAATLAVYEIDKAIYEVVYETRNRPAWVDIPMRAVATLARAASDTDAPVAEKE